MIDIQGGRARIAYLKSNSSSQDGCRQSIAANRSLVMRWWGYSFKNVKRHYDFSTLRIWSVVPPNLRNGLWRMFFII